MDFNMEEQFQNLINITHNIKTFTFGLKVPYFGPVDPTSIVTFKTNAFRVNLLVLAERVPAMYLPHEFPEDHLEAVTVYLNDGLFFQQYHEEINELLGLSVLVGDPEYSYDGTVQGAMEFFRKKGWDFEILY